MSTPDLAKLCRSRTASFMVNKFLDVPVVNSGQATEQKPEEAEEGSVSAASKKLFLERIMVYKL